MQFARRQDGFRWKSHTMAAVWLSLMGIVIVSGFPVANAEDDWLVAARKGWKRYLSRPLPGSWKERLTIQPGHEGKPAQVISRIGFADGEKLVVFTANGDPPGFAPSTAKAMATLAFAVNERYYFMVQRASQEARVWGLATLFKASEVLDHPEALYHDDGTPMRFGPVSISSRALLAEVFGNEHAEVVSAAEDVLDNDKLFRVVVKWTAPDQYRFPESSRFLGNGEYTLWLDPEHDWRVVREDEIASDGTRRRIIREFDATTGWCCKDTNWVVDASGKNTNGYVRSEYFDFDTDFRPPDELFYLGGYGIPEPAEFQEKRSWWLPLAIAGIICVVVGIWLMRSRT